jgi:hypothetical protein
MMGMKKKCPKCHFAMRCVAVRYLLCDESSAMPYHAMRFHTMHWIIEGRRRKIEIIEITTNSEREDEELFFICHFDPLDV